MKALYIGDLDGTSRHRAEAMRRIGWDVDHIDPRACFANSRVAEIWIWRAGSLGMEALIRRYLISQMRHPRYDICVVSHGEMLGVSVLEAIRERAGAILNYNGDNPFVSRDRRRWHPYLRALHLYDLHATPRISTLEEGERRGLNVTRFVQTADEVVHARRAFNSVDQERFGSDVSFIGTWMPERGPFVVRLLQDGIAVRIFGGNWHKAPEYERLKQAIVIPHVLGDEDYARAIQYARIALGFVSIGNQDFHTKRSVEVPALGTVLCAKRTEQHQQMYREDVEAVFWNDMDECALKCQELIKQPDRLKAISIAGNVRQIASPHWNQTLMTRLIDEALANAGRSFRKMASA